MADPLPFAAVTTVHTTAAGERVHAEVELEFDPVTLQLTGRGILRAGQGPTDKSWQRFDLSPDAIRDMGGDDR